MFETDKNTSDKVIKEKIEKKVERLETKGFHVEQSDSPTQEQIFPPSPLTQIDRIPLNITRNDRQVNLVVMTMNRITATQHLASIKPETVRDETYLAQARGLLTEDRTLAKITLLITTKDGFGKDQVLGYSDLTIHLDPQAGEIIVEAPMSSNDLTNMRAKTPDGFNNLSSNALDVREDMRGTGLGQFLVEAGSVLAAARFGATARRFSSDATTREGQGSFYVQKLGAEVVEKTPYLSRDDRAKQFPEMKISSAANQERVQPYLPDMMFGEQDYDRIQKELVESV